MVTGLGRFSCKNLCSRINMCHTSVRSLGFLWGSHTVPSKFLGRPVVMARPRIRSFSLLYAPPLVTLVYPNPCSCFFTVSAAPWNNPSVHYGRRFWLASKWNLASLPKNIESTIWKWSSGFLNLKIWCSKNKLGKTKLGPVNVWALKNVKWLVSWWIFRSGKSRLLLNKASKCLNPQLIRS